MVRGCPMSAVRPQNESSTTNEKESVMSSIVAPAIYAEVEYRRERISEDFRRSRTPRKVRAARVGHAPKPRLTARPA